MSSNQVSRIPGILGILWDRDGILGILASSGPFPREELGLGRMGMGIMGMGKWEWEFPGIAAIPRNPNPLGIPSNPKARNPTFPNSQFFPQDGNDSDDFM